MGVRRKTKTSKARCSRIIQHRGEKPRRCKLRAIPGRPYCRVHSPGLTVTTHGKRSLYRVGIFDEVIKGVDCGDVDRIKDLTPEITALRGMLQALMETVKIVEAKPEDTEAVRTLWGAAPMIASMLDQVGKLVKTMNQIDEGFKLQLNLRQVGALAQQIVMIINEEVQDPQLRAKISERISKLVIPS